MTAGFYSRAAMRRAREQREASPTDRQARSVTLAEVPADAK